MRATNVGEVDSTDTIIRGYRMVRSEVSLAWCLRLSELVYELVSPSPALRIENWQRMIVRVIVKIIDLSVEHKSGRF